MTINKMVFNVVANIGKFIFSLPGNNVLKTKFKVKGIVKGVMTLDMAVNDTERAVSPLAKWVNKLEVGPPGHKVTRMIPTATL